MSEIDDLVASLAGGGLPGAPGTPVYKSRNSNPMTNSATLMKDQFMRQLIDQIIGTGPRAEGPEARGPQRRTDTNKKPKKKKAPPADKTADKKPMEDVEDDD